MIDIQKGHPSGCVGIDGSVVECSPAMRAARVRFPVDAASFLPLYSWWFVHHVSRRMQMHLDVVRVIIFGKGGEKTSLETGGIDPPTSHMLSERSTI